MAFKFLREFEAHAHETRNKVRLKNIVVAEQCTVSFRFINRRWRKPSSIIEAHCYIAVLLCSTKRREEEEGIFSDARCVCSRDGIL